MCKNKLGILIIVALSLNVINAMGQATKSPFTSRGIGDIYDMSLIHNQGMGGVGISNGSYWYLNNINPALLPYNTLTVFAAGFVGENRKISNNVTSETNGGGNLNFLATAFPIKPGKWTTAVGLMPYSNSDYRYTFTDKVKNSDVDVLITEQGSGGFNQFYWSHGVRINKNFNVGVKATYLFSEIKSEFSNDLQGFEDGISFTPTLSQRISVSDFIFSGAIAFKKDSIFNNKIRLNLGVTYDFESDIKAKRFTVFEQQILGRPVTADTLQNDTRGSIVIPAILGAGISFTNGFKWTVGLDVRMQQWSDYKNFDGNNENLENSLKLGLGGEFTPDYSSVNNYLKRVTYRLGFSYENTPYVINDASSGIVNQQVKDFGINFGWSLPVGRFSSLDMAFKFGKRGNVTDNLISEDYFKVYLGLNFNDQWFRPRKYD